MMRVALQVLAVAGTVMFCGCDRILPQRDAALPDVADVQAWADGSGMNAQARFSGNVVELVVQQPADQLRRGGSLWARVGPYIYLFTPATRQLLDEHAAIAGVRVITVVGETEVARAMLARGTLNDITWRRAHNIVGTALEQGTQRPSTMERLVQFGEEVTQFSYNPDYVPPRD
jgi:hypothetical protein